jgi:DNA polymerase III delta prime subunit
MVERKNSIAYIYNPQNQSKEQLIDGFVVRLDIFKKLFKEIKDAKMEKPEQHYLIQGKRGMGKTSLLRRLSYEIENDIELNNWLMPLVFNEEEYGVSKLFQLWERVMELMWEKDNTFIHLKKEIQTLSQKIKDNGLYERALYELLSETLVEHKQKLILFIDNFGDVFNRFTEDEARRLRKILQTSSDLRIFAASSVMLEAFYEYKHPFYEFFKIEKLSGLNSDATRSLLLKLSEIYRKDNVKRIVETQPGRIETLRRLTGGVIRSIVLLFDIFSEDIEGNAFKDLEAILDYVTPLYKHRMDDLPTKQKEIVDIIALSWDAVTVKEICEKMREESKVISAQLNQLTKDEIIEKIPTNTKNHLYQVSERFFNIWYLMRLGRSAEKNRVLWLTRFLEGWCDGDMLVNRANLHLESIKNGTYDKRAAYFMTEAFARIKTLPKDLQHELLETTRFYLKDFNKEYYENLSKSDKTLLKDAESLANIPDYNKAIIILDEMVNPANLFKSFCYLGLGDESKSIETLMLEMFDMNLSITMLSDFYDKFLKDTEKAEKILIKYKDSSDVILDKLVVFYLHKHIKKEKALNNIEKFKEYFSSKIYTNKIAFVYLWNNQFEESLKFANSFLYQDDRDQDYYKNIDELFLLLLLAKKQYKYLYDYFTSEKGQAVHSKDRYKPIWYALMYYMRDEHPNEYLRMGDELLQTVEEIKAKVEQMAIDYA